MSGLIKGVAALGVMAMLAQGALAATTVTRLSGSGTVTGLVITNTVNGQVIRFTGNVSGSMTVVVEVDTPTEIDQIEIEVNRQSATSASAVQLICRAKPGSAGKLQRVGSVRPISLDSIADGELVIDSITTDASGTGGGNIGGRGTARGGEIRASIISNIYCAGNLTANLVAPGRPNGGQSNINNVQVGAGGSLYGDVRASQGVIGVVNVAGDIGPTVGSGITQPLIVARDGIRKVVCRDFNGNMSTVQNGAIGNVQRIQTTGNFAGTLSTMNLAIVDVIQTERGIVIGGNLSGSMQFAQGLISTFTVNGALSGTLDVGSVATDRPPFDPNRDTDVMFGAFPSSGRFISRASIAGPVTIAGPLDGEITLGSLTTPGHLYASISATSMSGSIDIHGSTQPTRNITLTGPLMPQARIMIGQSHMGGIVLPAEGLLGQVILNADTPTPTGTWSGTVTVGGVHIAAPANGEYAASADSLGGGVLATAPFRLNKAACTPAHDSPTPFVTSQFVGAASPTIQIRSYGPMTKAAGVQNWMDAVRIEREEPAGSCTWVNAEAAFDLTMVDEADGRELTVSSTAAGLPIPGTYRIVPIGLVSRGIGGNPAVVWPPTCGADAALGAYVFRIALDCDGDGQADPPGSSSGSGSGAGGSGGYYGNGSGGGGQKIPDANENGIPDGCEPETPPACSCDADGDRKVTADDIFVFLDKWFVSDAAADFNRTDGVTADDIFAFLDCWFASQGPCPQ